MLRLCANLSLLFNETPFLDRFAAAARFGFRGVEFHYPYEHPAHEVSARLKGHRITAILINSPRGDPERGEHGLACLRGRGDDFHRGIAVAIDYARAIGCPNIHVLAGIAPLNESPAQVYSTYVSNLGDAADRLAAAGLTGLVEPLSSREAPGYFLHGFDVALRALTELDRANLRLQFDVYHAHLMGLDVLDCVDRYIEHVGHVQVADAPGRHEPGTGAIPVGNVLERLEARGYSGWIGLEYRPHRDTTSSLAWAREHLVAEQDADPSAGH